MAGFLHESFLYGCFSTSQTFEKLTPQALHVNSFFLSCTYVILCDIELEFKVKSESQVELILILDDPD